MDRLNRISLKVITVSKCFQSQVGLISKLIHLEPCLCPAQGLVIGGSPVLADGVNGSWLTCVLGSGAEAGHGEQPKGSEGREDQGHFRQGGNTARRQREV